jgi:PIN domain nuclease of toxin-antitoxin system
MASAGSHPPRVVLDAHAVLIFLGHEPGWETVEGALRRTEPWMNLVNLGEVAYVIQRHRGAAQSDLVWSSLRSSRASDPMSIRWIPVDDALVRAAADIKAHGGLSFPDAFAAASARQLGCPVLTGDPEFERAEGMGVVVRWLR